MKFHLMQADGENSLDAIKEISTMADSCNYYSVLFVYHSLVSDSWIKCANVINKKHKFKFHIAIRSYSISPEYFVMMYKSFNQIQKNRIMFNIVAGDIHDSEESIQNLILNKENFDTVEKRVQYTNLWIKKTLFLLEGEDTPEIVMSGISDKTLDSAALFADYTLCMVDTYIDNPELFKRNKNRMVCAAIVIRETYDEAEKIVNEIKEKHQKRWTIFGTEEQVVEKINYLNGIGVTDLLIKIHHEDSQYDLVHNLIRKNKGVI